MLRAGVFPYSPEDGTPAAKMERVDSEEAARRAELVVDIPVSYTHLDPEQLRRGVGIILKESRRLTSMVEELLDFSKMEDGRFTLSIEQVDLQAEFEDAIYTYRELFKQEAIELDVYKRQPL